MITLDASGRKKTDAKWPTVDGHKIVVIHYIEANQAARLSHSKCRRG